MLKNNELFERCMINKYIREIGEEKKESENHFFIIYGTLHEKFESIANRVALC